MLKELTEKDFTDGQVLANIKIDKFLKSPERIFILTGKAGTGKTTIIRYALKKLIDADLGKITYSKQDERVEKNVLGVALAHKAKNNLQQSIPFVNTFASAYGHKEKHDKQGRRIFIPDPKRLPYADCKRPIRVFVIDECSMFSQKMLSLVLKETSMYGKIIFMGDRGQLPPITDENDIASDKDSPVFDLTIPDFCKHELTERVRQTEGNPIIDLSDIVYEEIFGDNDINKVYQALSQRNIKDDVGHDICTGHELYDLYLNASEDYLDTKVLAYRNITVDTFNRYLRNYIHNNPEEVLIPKEIIYLNSTFYGKEREKGNFVFYNSSEYIVQDVNKGSFDGVNVKYARLDNVNWIRVVDGFKGSHNYNVYQDRVDEYSAVKNWKQMWGFIDCFANFSYGYALTCYKAQGSTYKNVFVHIADILNLMVLSDKRKLQTIYTAITRASHKVYFIID